MPLDDRATYSFKEFRLHPAHRVLVRDGQTVPLTSKAFDLLLTLIERRDRVVSKDDLMTLVWPDTIVEENNLTVTMSALRKALGEQRTDHRFIVTIPGHGYRFVAEVAEAAPAAAAVAAGPQPLMRGNVPIAANAFIGRAQEIAELTRLVAERRLVTLTGSGGCGKTRLAIEVARALEPTAAGSVWLIELAPISDPGLVPQVVASALGIREAPAQAIERTLLETLAHSQPLLVLDNCEHLIDACARFAEQLLARVPGARVLATSREPLSIPGETIWRVPSLSMPEHEQPVAAAEVSSYDAVRLFVDRASSVFPAFALTDANAATVAHICRRLDGIPLALELAAARAGVVTVEQLAERLDDQFKLLASGPRTALPRHRTLRASIDWSHALLSPGEQALLRRFSVFHGGWTLDAAECVAGGDADDDVFHRLASLVNKSLVIADHSTAAGARYRLLETVRQYGRERLTDAGEEDDARRRHLRFFLAQAERAEAGIYGPDAAVWLETVALEHDNIRTALDYALGRDAESSLRLIAAMRAFWSVRGYLREGTERTRAALDRAGAGVPPLLRARALMTAMSLEMFRGDLTRVAGLARECLALARPGGATDLVAYSLLLLAGYHLYQEGDFARAVPMLEESLALARQTGDPFLIALVTVNLGFPALLQGDIGRAGVLLDEGLRLARALGNPWMLAAALVNSGLHAHAIGRHEEAISRCQESLALRSAQGDRWGMIQSLEALAQMAADRGDGQRAARLLAMSAGLGRSIGADVPIFVRTIHARTEACARALVGDDRFTAAWSEALAIPADRVVAAAAD